MESAGPEVTAALCCFPSTSPLHVSGLMSAEAATVCCERTDVTCDRTCVFAILRVQQCGVFLRATASGKRKEEKRKVKKQ